MECSVPRMVCVLVASPYQRLRETSQTISGALYGLVWWVWSWFAFGFVADTLNCDNHNKEETRQANLSGNKALIGRFVLLLGKPKNHKRKKA